MLVNFRCNNFLSFNSLTEFSMVKGSARKHPNHKLQFKDVSVLKFAALYGANAAGKSSLVSAVGFSKNIILKGINKSGAAEKFCKIDPENKYKNSDFEYEIVIADKVYSYGFSVNLFEKVIDREWLYYLSDNEEEYIFTREFLGKEEINSIDINFKYLNLSKEDELRLNIYISDLKYNTDSLIITELNLNKKKFEQGNRPSILNMLYLWFYHKLVVITPDDGPNEDGISYIRKDKGIALAKFLDAFGTGVKEICSKEVHEKDLYNELPPKLVKDILEDLRDEKSNVNGLLRTSDNIYQLNKEGTDIKIDIVKFKHSHEEVLYSLGEESDGTVRLVELYDILASDNEKVYVVDEIDRSLHPNLTFKFIENFLNKEINSQLIVTTHEDRLLDLNMLRRDEIWFVDKQENGESELYSLEKFKERFDKDVLKAYLDGRYGSVPKFKVFN